MSVGEVGCEDVNNTEFSQDNVHSRSLQWRYGRP